MLIGLFSDTHDQVERARAAVRQFRDAGARAIIHCGDLTTPAVVEACEGIPGYFVFGNCDYDRAALAAAIGRIGGTCLGDGGLVTLADRRIAVTHGHLDAEVRRLTAERPDYLFYGHTHRREDAMRGPTRWINPGALHRANPWTMATLDLASSRLEMLTICN
ncbi:phosphodiesterase [Aquisphaera giovannonii]|uniref:Phosphoesterase n=1 Tax=Aquisphaera giovannonii TaxID=406548 RepID=A0A5B9W5Y4_9BACT|nr:metallophosphoesterase family protein [Aquisphaera giovannonii]QEH36086.1 phosphodiesterase [Aquisphaera giovannonii]